MRRGKPPGRGVSFRRDITEPGLTPAKPEMNLQHSQDDAGEPAAKPCGVVDPVDEDFQSALMDSLLDPVTVSSEDPGWTALPEFPPPGPATKSEPVFAPEERGALNPSSDAEAAASLEHGFDEAVEALGGLDMDFEKALLAGLADEPEDPPLHPDETETPRDGVLPDLPGVGDWERDAASFDAAIDPDEESIEDISDAPSVRSDDLPPDPAVLSRPEYLPPEAMSAELPSDPGALPDAGSDGETGDTASSASPDGPAAALAFATDPETEDALREGLLRYEGTSPDSDDPQVWPGGLRAALAALADGQSPGLLIVDIDGVAYPAGAIHQLAEVCDIGTVVIAIGSNDTARLGRELLLAGVSDYLAKPVTPEAVRQAAERATGEEWGRPVAGCVTGFAGTGGSGATTLAAATALRAAEQGRYVSVLDLNRTVSAMALLLDVEPAPGLDQLFEMAGAAPPDPKLVDGVRAERSERISVYAYRLGPVLPPVPAKPAIAWLLGQLRHRSQVVLVDGLDDPEICIDLLGTVDMRVIVVEPTSSGSARAARMLGLLAGSSPVLLVQNHTRAFRSGAGARLLSEAGVDSPPDFTVPFNPALPQIASRGWSRGGLPRSLTKPVGALAERLSAPVLAGRPYALAGGA